MDILEAIGDRSLVRLRKVVPPNRAGIRIVAVEPAESSVLLGGQPGPHKIEGVGIGYTPPLWDPALVDEILPVKTGDANGRLWPEVPEHRRVQERMRRCRLKTSPTRTSPRRQKCPPACTARCTRHFSASSLQASGPRRRERPRSRTSPRSASIR